MKEEMWTLIFFTYFWSAIVLSEFGFELFFRELQILDILIVISFFLEHIQIGKFSTII